MAQAADDWHRIETLLGGADYTSLAIAVTDLTAEQRAALVPRLRAYVRPNPDAQFRRLDDAGLGIVGAGLLPDAATVVSWLGNRYLGYYTLEPDGWSGSDRHVSRDAVPHVHFVLRERNVPWLADLARRLAERLPKDPVYRTDLFDLTSRLLSDTEQAPPTTDGFVAGWVRSHSSENLETELTADPRLATLVPRFFETEAVGVLFSHDSSWGVALEKAAAHGLVDRTALLNSCVQRLRRGGKPGTTRAYLDVYDKLAPSSEEITERIDAYLAMLQAPLSTVAGMAQQALFTLDDLGRLPPITFVAASRELLLRSEKKLVRAQLARMKAVAQRDRSLADDLARAATNAFGSAAADMMRAMVVFIVGLASSLSGAVCVDIAEAATALPSDLRADLLQVMSPAAATPATASSAPPRPVWSGLRRVTPITDVDELVAELPIALQIEDRIPDLPVFERVLEALVRFGSAQPNQLREAMAPILQTVEWGWRRPAGDDDDYHDDDEDDEDDGYATSYDDFGLGGAVAALAAAAIGAPAIARDTRARGVFGQPPTTPAQAAIGRMYALADAVRVSRGPRLVSLPTWSTGVISATDLRDRLSAAAAEDWEPWPFDLEQALLRLDAGEDSAASFAALGSVAGDRVRDWLSAALPGPVRVTTTSMRTHEHHWDGSVVDTGELLVAEVRSSVEAGVIWNALTALTYPHSTHLYVAYGPELFSTSVAILPLHRDVIAAHSVVRVARASESKYESSLGCGIFMALAEADGPIGVGTNLVFGYGLNAKLAESRRPAVDALAVLAARDQLPAIELGRTLAALINRRAVVVTRIVDGLRATADLGATGEMWDVVAALLGDVLAHPPAPTGMAELLSLAAELAAIVRPKTEIPGLDALAAARGSSRQLVEARRLLRLLETAD